jgi:hypothetical protein
MASFRNILNQALHLPVGAGADEWQGGDPWGRPPFSRVGFFMDPLVEGVHAPSFGEFPCARASVAAGDALGRAEVEEPLWEDVAQSRIGGDSRNR